jgi:hypothetical protein
VVKYAEQEICHYTFYSFCSAGDQTQGWHMLDKRSATEVPPASSDHLKCTVERH